MTLNLKSAPNAAIVLLVFFVLIRLWSGGGRFSYFAVIGSEFSEERTDIVRQEGPGYDGQFFFRYALDPSGKADVGIEVDHPAYRHQRILYPLLAWMLAFGREGGIPLALVMINVLAVIFSCLALKHFLNRSGGDERWAFMPLALSGIWMALGRDLAECLEAFFLLSFFLSLLSERFLISSVYAAVCLFTRESAILLIGPALLTMALHQFSAWSSGSFRILVFSALPVLLFTIWKIFLFQLHASPQFLEGGNNISAPFTGMYQGLIYHVRALNGLKGLAEFLVWLAYFVWNVWLAVTVMKEVRTGLSPYLKWAWITGLTFALLFSVSIYNDDWSFARVLTGFNLVSGLILMHKNIWPSKYFLLYTFALVSGSVIRMWLRP